MAKQVRVMFGDVPGNFEDFSFASQVSQAEAMKFFIEMFRSVKWRRTGIIWWNIMDGWPQLSDAVVDYYFQRKLAYDYIKRSQAPVSLMLREPTVSRQELVVCNDTRRDFPLNYKVRDLDSGEVVSEGLATASADAVTSLGQVEWPSTGPRFLLLTWEGDGFAGMNHYLQGTPPYDLQQYRVWTNALSAYPHS
jgi:beta-mannosidase